MLTAQHEVLWQLSTPLKTDPEAGKQFLDELCRYA